MAGRANKQSLKIESEIDKNRDESNWSKVIELASQLKDKSPESENLAYFLIGEGRLENYLEEWPPIEQNVNKAKFELVEAKRYLQLATSDMGERVGVALDAHLLLGKLFYAWCQYDEGLKNYDLAKLHALPEKKLTLRSMRIVAESFAIKGLCLQKDQKATTKYKKAEKEDEIIKCFNIASDLALLYMQEVDKQQMANNANNSLNSTGTLTNTPNTGTQSPQPPSSNKTLSTVLEIAILESAGLYLNQNKYYSALERYRNSLGAVESQGVVAIRLKLLCQMAEMLLQGVLFEEYQAPEYGNFKEGCWKPKLYTTLHQFMPKNEYEETLLVIMVAESLVVRNAVLSQSPEFKDARESAYQDAMTVYDLLTMATVRWGQLSLLQESLERAMKFSFEEQHLWKQHALSLLAVGNYNHALKVLKEVIRLDSHSSINCLLAAKLCYAHLNLIQDGTEFSKEALKRELSYSSGLLGRSYLYVGIGYHLQANNVHVKQDKQELINLAMQNFEIATQLEPNDHLCEYYLALQLALKGNITEALSHIHLAWTLQPDNSSTLHLFALLLSADSQHDKALDVVETALDEYPDNLNLMYVKAHLELYEEGGEKALITAKQMLELWKVIYEGQTNADLTDYDRKSDSRSVFQLYTSEMSDKDSSSLQAQSITASRIEAALSEVASSLSSFNPKPGPQRAWLLLLELWLLLGEIYLTLDQPEDVQLCIQEATQIYPMSHHIMHMRGLLHMYKQEWMDAKVCFQNAVAINPLHIKSLQQLGLVYHYLGLQGLAEMTLREAARLEPNNHITWYNMGKVLESLGEYDTASSAMKNSITVERTSPILPFTSVPITFE